MVGFLEAVIALVFGYIIWCLIGLWCNYRKMCHLVKDFSQFGPCHPLWGHLFLLKDLKWLVQGNDSMIYGSNSHMAVFWVAFIPLIMAFHPDTAKIILKSDDPKPNKSGQVYHVLKTICGDGLVVSNGKKWERNRKLLTPAFHFDVLRPYVAIYNEATDILLDKIARQMAENPKSIEITEAINLVTIDIILRCSLSYEGNIQSQSEHPYATAIHNIGALATKRFSNPLHYLSWNLFKLSANGKAYVENINFIHRFAEELIAKRRQALADDPSLLNKRRLDFLDILMTAKDDNGEGMSDEDIRDEVDTFMFAGHDTTLCALIWAIYHLGKYPGEQAKVYREVCEVVGGKKYVEWEDIGKLTKLTMFLKESLRIFPPAGSTSRMLSKDVDFDGVTISAGTSVSVSILGIHHNKHVFPDPKVFKPERFLPENTAKRDHYAFLPFSAGPRNCIGQSFAMNELKVILSRIIKRFTVVLDQDHPVIPVSELVIKARHGIRVRFEER